MLTATGVVVAAAAAAGEEPAGVEEPLPDAAVDTAGVAVGEDEDDEEPPFDDAGVAPELPALELPLPESQPEWWPLSEEPEPWPWELPQALP